jgi:hypothetical protein
MPNPIGAVLITLGLVFIFGGWQTGSVKGMVFCFAVGPALINYGWQLIK